MPYPVVPKSLQEDQQSGTALCGKSDLYLEAMLWGLNTDDSVQRAHSGSLLNDNQDGTLSQIGYYSKSQPGITVLPPLIISKNPLDPKEPPMETPGLPGQGGHAPKVSKHQVVIKNPQGTTQSRQLSTSDATELWDYMRPHLPNLLTSISKDDNALILFHLHRRREVQWRPNMQNVKVEDDRRQILGLLIYLTGEKHRDGEKSCTHCVRRNGPFLGCMILTSGVPKGLRPLVRSCANCVFTHKSSSCSVKSVWGKDADERSQSEAATAKKRVWAAYDESEEPMATRRRSDRLGLADQEDKAKTEEPRKKIVTLSLKRNSQTPGSGGAVEMPMPTSAVSNGGAVKRELSSALIHAGQVQPDELLEMEDWEIAPGRIRGSGADGVNNSKSFHWLSRECALAITQHANPHEGSFPNTSFPQQISPFPNPISRPIKPFGSLAT